jgi:hypothetical protein
MDLVMTVLVLSCLAAALMAFGQSAPVVIAAPVVQDLTTQQIRQARGAMFNNPGQPRLEDMPPGAPPFLQVINLRKDIPELPTKGIDAILVGQLIAAQPYQSNDHSAIYVESTSLVEQVFNQRSGSAKPGDKITLVQNGGSMLLASGRAISQVTAGSGNPLQVNGRYLFFLIYSSGGECYRVGKAWWLTGGKAVALSTDDLIRVQAGTSQYNNATESVILAAAKFLVPAPLQ